MEVKQLINEAITARKQAYAAYSGFQVGAAILTSSQKVFHGCNIENASYGLTNCAERTAIFKAISEGHKEFEAIAIVGDTDGPISPCGACRQVLAEFCKPETQIILADLKGQSVVTTINELLPGYFTASDMNK
ncbi:cytidine deaminase [Peribacillus deserti]|uniref:Cytidine deaminase n=1 Tax=Peribacillus deserti TaxID=673318 RepID=A0ABS2QDE2_9BACI|nr:cytidine deaminase [Peribacillus deserti]MBM7691000.1 cytidine deaminase [Peribacillus deserti]